MQEKRDVFSKERGLVLSKNEVAMELAIVRSREKEREKGRRES